MTTPKPKRRWFQYSVRTLLVLVTVAAVPCSWVAVKTQQARRERAIAPAIERIGGTAVWATPSGPAWLRKLLGDDQFTSVDIVRLQNPGITDADLKCLDGLRRLRQLDLYGTRITDAGMQHVKGLSQLEGLYLNGTRVTDVGLQSPKGLGHLQVLQVGGTQVTDIGLKHLREMSQLQALDLAGTKVTDAGLENLEGLSQLQVRCSTAPKSPMPD